ncbi:MAG: hypothetical protein K6E40_18785, partial [Desulfovibrio sp.]|nr:hypothetical protein [Desulfovibrio sp.]
AGERFFAELGLSGPEPEKEVMRLCLSLAGADTATSALVWWRTPIAEVQLWAEVQGEELKKRQRELEKRSRKRR